MDFPGKGSKGAFFILPLVIPNRVRDLSGIKRFLKEKKMKKIIVWAMVIGMGLAEVSVGNVAQSGYLRKVAYEEKWSVEQTSAKLVTQFNLFDSVWEYNNASRDERAELKQFIEIVNISTTLIKTGHSEAFLKNGIIEAGFKVLRHTRDEKVIEAIEQMFVALVSAEIDSIRVEIIKGDVQFPYHFETNSSHILSRLWDNIGENSNVNTAVQDIFAGLIITEKKMDKRFGSGRGIRGWIRNTLKHSFVVNSSSTLYPDTISESNVQAIAGIAEMILEADKLKKGYADILVEDELFSDFVLKYWHSLPSYPLLRHTIVEKVFIPFAETEGGVKRFSNKGMGYIFRNGGRDKDIKRNFDEDAAIAELITVMVKKGDEEDVQAIIDGGMLGFFREVMQRHANKEEIEDKIETLRAIDSMFIALINRGFAEIIAKDAGLMELMQSGPILMIGGRPWETSKIFEVSLQLLNNKLRVSPSDILKQFKFSNAVLATAI